MSFLTHVVKPYKLASSERKMLHHSNVMDNKRGGGGQIQQTMHSCGRDDR